jgi:hypothetical protein
MPKEIYYMLAYDTETKRWFNADAMINVLTNGNGSVLEGEGESGSFRQIEDGMEMDMDFENTELLTEFLRHANGER